MCACAENQDCYCEALQHYASACSARDVKIDWIAISNCTGFSDRLHETCPKPELFLDCATLSDNNRFGIECNSTCQDSKLDCKPETCVSGCFCPHGTIKGIKIILYLKVYARAIILSKILKLALFYNRREYEEMRET